MVPSPVTCSVSGASAAVTRASAAALAAWVASARTPSAIAAREASTAVAMRASTSPRPSRTAERASPASWSCTPAVAVCTAPATDASRRCSAAVMRASVDCSIAPRAAATDWSTWAPSWVVRSARSWAARSSAVVPSCVVAASRRVVTVFSSSPRRSSKRLSSPPPPGSTTAPSSRRASTSRMRTRLPWASVRLSRNPDSCEDAALQGADVDGGTGRVGQRGAQAVEVLDLAGRRLELLLQPGHRAAKLAHGADLAAQVGDVPGAVEVGGDRAVDARLLVLEHRAHAADLLEQPAHLGAELRTGDRRRHARGRPAADDGGAQLGGEPLRRHLGEVLVVDRRIAQVEGAAGRYVLGGGHLERAAHGVDQRVPIVGVDRHPGALGPEPGELVEQAR